MAKATKEDFELLLGLNNVDDALDRVMRDIWVPFWRNLPKELKTPRTLIYNKELVYSMLEALGSNLVSEKATLDYELKCAEDQHKRQNENWLEWFASLATLADSCVAYDDNPFNSQRFNDDLDSPFLGEEEETDPTQITIKLPQQSDDDMTGPYSAHYPQWKVCLTFVRGENQTVISRELTHEELIRHFGNKVKIVKEDPESYGELDFGDSLTEP